ncbi:hypothetical protein [Archangium violaceum]|uniref:hypothetical protein n=1 Tax=Archangium violaceum TaxID=83451 RepID=UPI0036DCA17D
MDVSDAVTAAAAFVGGYLGQRQAAGELGEDVKNLGTRVAALETRGRRLWAVVADLGRRVRQLEAGR